MSEYLARGSVLVETDTTPTSLGLVEVGGMVWVISPCCSEDINGVDRVFVQCSSCRKTVCKLEKGFPGSRGVAIRSLLEDPEWAANWISAWTGYPTDDLKVIRL